jgi:hypothetical protein
MFKVQAMFRYGTMVEKKFRTRSCAMNRFIAYCYSPHVVWCEIQDNGILILSSFRDDEGNNAQATKKDQA